MKPSPEQVREWAKKAGAKFDPHWGIAYNTGTATFERFAELAAAWGAKQAQQTTEPLGFQIRRAIAAEDELRATKQTLEHAYAALQKVADAQAAIEEPVLLWREIADCVIAALSDRAGILSLDVDADTEEEIRQEVADTIQAGVRAGMARGQTLQALQRGVEKVLADPEKYGLDLGGQK